MCKASEKGRCLSSRAHAGPAVGVRFSLQVLRWKGERRGPETLESRLRSESLRAAGNNVCILMHMSGVYGSVITREKVFRFK